MADENHITNKNPHFKHISRAPYELGRLLQEIGEINAFGKPKVTAEASQKIQAAIQHAENANVAVLSGLEALGECLFKASENLHFTLDYDVVGDIGCLIQHLAVEAQFLQETEANLNCFLKHAEVIQEEVHHG